MSARNVVLTVGNTMMGDDGAGPLLAELLGQQPVDGWAVVDGGSAPENHVDQVLSMKPEHVVVFDAAEMGLEPGDLRIVDADAIAEMMFMTTHNMPLNFLIDRIKESGAEVTFLGVQPAVVAFYFPMMDAVRTAVENVHASLLAGSSPAQAFPLL